MIQFRFWDRQEEEMSYFDEDMADTTEWDYLNDEEPPAFLYKVLTILIEHLSLATTSIYDNNFIMQWTGERDKNNKPIYVYDVLKFTPKEELNIQIDIYNREMGVPSSMPKEHYAVVHFKGGAFTCEGIKQKEVKVDFQGKGMAACIKEWDVTVIGNIFETEEYKKFFPAA